MMAEPKLDVFPRRPRWLDEEPTLQDLLSRFLDKVEQTERLSLRVSSKSLPELYNTLDYDPAYLWALIRELDKEYHILSIKLAPTKPYQAPYEGAQVNFVPEKEALVREWLNRPRLDPYALLWEKTLQKMSHQFEDFGEALAETIIRVSHKSPEHILKVFAKVGSELREPMSLPALSARCFWGDSKFLDRREGLIHALYPSISHLVIPRPILLNVTLPEHIERVLFVENQDTFHLLSNLKPSHTALVYSAGFSGSAPRVRDHGNAAFAILSGGQHLASVEQFQNWWFERSHEDWPTHFWGDLDFAGCAILKSLRQSFTALVAWQAGYRPLLAMIERGEGHGHTTCGKEFQVDPETTGCVYTDEVILPALRESGIFVDQEAVLGSDLTGFR